MSTPPNRSFSAGKHNSKDNKRKRVIKALIDSTHPLTRRQLSACTNLEITSLCQPLYDLVYKYRLVKISHYGICVTTGMRVMHFQLMARVNHDADGE